MRRYRVLILLCTLVRVSPLHAQLAVSDPVARREALMKLSFLVGDWSGDARMSRGPGGMENFRQTEHVRLAVGGQALVINGVGRMLVGDVPGDTAFQALGVLDWRPDRGYQLRSMTHEGREGTFPVTLLPEAQGIVWGFEVPGGRVRYTVRLTPEGDWHERGEFSRDGTQWMPTLEMRLKKLATHGQ